MRNMVQLLVDTQYIHNVSIIFNIFPYIMLVSIATFPLYNVDYHSRISDITIANTFVITRLNMQNIFSVVPQSQFAVPRHVMMDEMERLVPRTVGWMRWRDWFPGHWDG